MAYTGQQIVDRVREQINDNAGRDVGDGELLRLVNDCAKVLLNKRPDLRVGSYATALTDISLVQNFPFADQYLPAVIDYCVSMSQRPDDEAHEASFSQAAMAKFEHDIFGG